MGMWGRWYYVGDRVWGIVCRCVDYVDGWRRGYCVGGWVRLLCGSVCHLMDCCDGQAPHSKVQVAFLLCCGTPIERNQVWGEDKAMHPQPGAV